MQKVIPFRQCSYNPDFVTHYSMNYLAILVYNNLETVIDDSFGFDICPGRYLLRVNKDLSKNRFLRSQALVKETAKLDKNLR